MAGVVELYRDFREFLAAKKRKREPVRWLAKGGAAAEYVPRAPQGFSNFRAALRGVADWGRASERLDGLERALRRRHAVGLPLPRKVVQNEDRSLTLFWRELSVRCFEDRICAFIGGPKGTPIEGVTSDLLDALAFQSRIQGAS